MELNGAPLTCEALIWDFQGGTVGYIAHAVEQTLLLPKDMADLRSLRQHEVFLGLKRDLAMVTTLTLNLLSILYGFFLNLNLTSLSSQAT